MCLHSSCMSSVSAIPEFLRSCANPNVCIPCPCLPVPEVLALGYAILAISLGRRLMDVGEQQRAAGYSEDSVTDRKPLS